MLSRISSPAEPEPTRWWLLLAGASAALILGGSLFPFRIRTELDLGLLEVLGRLDFRRTTRGDIVANLLLYMPLGLCLMFAWGPRHTRFAALARTVVVGTALSLAVEIMQIYLRLRVSSLTDVALNSLGTLAGASAAMAYARSAGPCESPPWRRAGPILPR